MSAAFNADSSLSGASLIPREVTFDNFKNLFASGEATKHIASAADYPWWYLNTLIVAAATAFLTVLIGALGAYAFSRFRFKGRRMGMLFLLLIQMFPQVLLVVAIYLIVFNAGDVFHVIGLNTLTGLIVVHLGGVMGVNTWLMKGFFDTIPSELDESARVDGATPAQVYWGVVLPLAAPILAVVGLLTFIFTINEFIIPSVLLQPTKRQTLPVGLFNFVSRSTHRAGARSARAFCSPRSRSSSCSSRCRSSSSAASRRARSRDERRRSSTSRPRLPSRTTTARTPASSSGRPSSATGRSCSSACRAASSADTVALRYVDDGEPRDRPGGRRRRDRTARRCGAQRSVRRTRRRATAGCSPAARSAGRG